MGSCKNLHSLAVLFTLLNLLTATVAAAGLVEVPADAATIGAGIAVGPVGTASMAVISERPELFGRTLIYLGLAEGIAIYGLIIAFMIISR